MPRASCPRCATVVSYDEGSQPTCPACGYPGADTRVRQEPPAAPSRGEQPGWSSEPAAAPAAAPGAAPPQRTSGKAIASLVLGCTGIIIYPLALILGIIGLVLGIVARKDIRQSNGTLGGNGIAIAGIVVSIVATVVVGIIVLAAVVFVLVSDLGEESAQVALGAFA